MYKDILRTMAGIEVFPLLSLVLFVAVFAVVLIWAVRLDGSRLTRYSQLPLDEPAANSRDTGISAAEEGVRS